MNDSFVKSITDLIQSIYDKVVASAGVLVGVSTAIAGLGCLVYIATIILPMIERGQRIEIYPLLKPIFVAFVITTFVSLASGVSDVSSKIGTSLSSLVSVGDANSLFKTFKGKVDEMLGAEKKANSALTGSTVGASTESNQNSTYETVVSVDDFSNTKNVMDSHVETITKKGFVVVSRGPNTIAYKKIDENGQQVGPLRKLIFKKASVIRLEEKAKKKMAKESGAADETNEDSGTKWFEELLWTIVYGYIVPALAWVAFFLGQLIYIFMYMSSKFYLAILTIVGPLSFALSQFKPLAGSASQWLARFISISLWPGLCGLIQGVNHMLMKAVAENLQPTFTGVIVSIALLIFSATLYFHVPTIADFVIQSGGIGGSAGTAKKMGNKLWNKIRGK